jgi:hypothetical protein
MIASRLRLWPGYDGGITGEWRMAQADPIDARITGMVGLVGVVTDTIRGDLAYRQPRDKRMLPFA